MNRQRTWRAAGATLAVLVGLSGLVSAPLVAVLTLPSNTVAPSGPADLVAPGRWALLAALVTWIVVAVAVALALAGLRRPPRRHRWLPLRVQHRLESLVELSAFGVGGLRGWTGANPQVGLDRVRRPSDDVTRRLRLPAGGHHRPVGDPSGDARATARHRRRDGAGGGAGGARAGSPLAAPTGAEGAGSPADHRLTGPTRPHEIQRGETWWSLAERHLGEGRRWTALRDLNLGVEAAPGVLIDQDSVLRPGWRINVPAAADGGSPAAWPASGVDRAGAARS